MTKREKQRITERLRERYGLKDVQGDYLGFDTPLYVRTYNGGRPVTRRLHSWEEAIIAFPKPKGWYGSHGKKISSR